MRLEHSRDLHLCQAFMAEVQRHGQVAVSSVMHRLTRQVREEFSSLLTEPFE